MGLLAPWGDAGLASEGAREWRCTPCWRLRFTLPARHGPTLRTLSDSARGCSCRPSACTLPFGALPFRTTAGTRAADDSRSPRCSSRTGPLPYPGPRRSAQLQHRRPDLRRYVPRRHRVRRAAAARFRIRVLKLALPTRTETITSSAFERTSAGMWHFHCHLLFHMLEGLQIAFNVGEESQPEPPESYYEGQSDFTHHDGAWAWDTREGRPRQPWRRWRRSPE